jgi:hypothetical protein
LKGLIIKSSWANLILEGLKTWEIRSSNTKIRGTVYIIKSGTGMIYGSVDIVGSLFVPRAMFPRFYYRHQVPAAKEIKYKRLFAWEMENHLKFIDPVPFKHPQGAVIWVDFDEPTQELIKVAVKFARLDVKHG